MSDYMECWDPDAYDNRCHDEFEICDFSNDEEEFEDDDI